MKTKSELPFYFVMGGLSAGYVVLIALLVIANVAYVTPTEFFGALQKPEIQASTWLTLKTCTVSAIVSLWIGVPLGYLLARCRFPGRWLVETLVDIPIILPPLVVGLSLLILFHLMIGSWQLEGWLRDDIGFPVTFHWPAIVLAQFTVACAFVVKTMRVTFDRIDPRGEAVARTLGCSRGQAFMRVALPQAWTGLVTAFTIAWARALGEFGPILVFAGATRMRTEVLATSVFLELSVGELGSAVAVSLLMVAIAIGVLFLLRIFGSELRT